MLKFFPDPNNFVQHWEFSIAFAKDDLQYRIKNSTVQYVIDDNFPITALHGGQWYKHTKSTFGTAAKVGSYFSCDSVEYQMDGLKVSLYYAKIQPFAHDVPDNGYGTRGPCLKYTKKNLPSDSGSSTVAVVVSILLVTMAVGIVVAVLYNRKKKSHGVISYQRN
ncbi:uncharacterized protein [Antedon mediterranea]|uniref:uncharacterized protein n=1 Tax=Antedon mediterranea TaxID=105859 RepID=UPI003AF68879